MSLAREMLASGLSAVNSQAINGSVATGLTAAGSTQATALALPAAVNAISTAAASTGVILPSNANNGDAVMVYNGGANSVSVYPPVGGTINNLSANTALAVATTKSALFICTAALTWIATAGA